MQIVMKFMLLVLITFLGAGLAIVPAQAQTDSRVLVDIPFDFAVGNTTLKAGSYQVKELQSGILGFSSNDGQQHQFALTVPNDAANSGHQPKLVFVRYGNESFLSKVFLSGDDDCLELLRSSRQKTLIQKGESGEELALLIQTAP